MTTDPSRDAFEDFLRDKWHPSAHAQLLARTGSEYSNHIIQERWVGWQAAMAHKATAAWQPIATAPRDKTVLLGYRNSHGHWRTLRGEWFSLEEIYDHWEDPEGVDAGWFEMSVEADDVPNVWRTNPTHWMPLPAAPLNTTTKPA